MNTKFILPFVVASSIFIAACGSSPAEKQIEAQTAQIEAQADLTVEKKKTVKQETSLIQSNGRYKHRLFQNIIKTTYIT